MVDKKITLLGPAITVLPNTSIELPLETSAVSTDPFLSFVVNRSFCNPKQEFASEICFRT
jgi:hypothetical protein